MKNQVPPAVFITAIVVVVVIACIFGLRMLQPDRSRAATTQTGMTPEQQAQYEAQRSGHGPNSSGMGMSAGSMGQYRQYQQNSAGGR